MFSQMEEYLGYISATGDDAANTGVYYQLTRRQSWQHVTVTTTRRTMVVIWKKAAGSIELYIIKCVVDVMRTWDIYGDWY